ncbi:hypothetical protein [Legionella sp. km772]|uniref:hypothetical protein n=1 Tax=Legionella sp. km772 TaxID=2498111 RepID=UPI000F8E056A|nr:hypothetical protein [Legionella sp. km772]RUR10401.1 hypothetical protein ELY15_08175 [Legionella sp. km772]
MPTKALFDLVSAKKYSEATALLRENPDWVNAIEDESKESLLQYCTYRTSLTDGSTDFMEQVLTHPKLAFTFVDSSGETNQHTLIRSNRMDLIKHVLNRPEFLLLGGELSLLAAEKTEKAALSAVGRAEKRKKPVEEISKLTTDYHAAQEVTLAIKQATLALASTIKVALTPEHVVLLENLQATNATPKTIAPVAVTASVAAAKGPGFFTPSKETLELKEAEEALKNLNLEYAKARAAIHQKGINEAVEALDKVAATSSFTYK